MSLFMLETEMASSGAEQITSVANQVSNLSSTVGSYDVSCEDGFDFATPRGVLAKNLEACSIKMQNTSKIIESVVSNHTELQNGLKFDSPADTEGLDDVSEAGEDYGSEDELGAYDDYGGGGSYYGGGGGGDYGSAAAAAPAIAIPSVTPLAENKEDDVELDESSEFDGEEGEEKSTESFDDGIVTTQLTSSGYAYLEPDLINEDTKKFISDSQFSYDDDGYARHGDYYVISCDTSVGKVGDIIQFKQKDGTVVDCMVGVNNTSDKFKGSVNFIVKKDATQFKALDFTKTLISNNETVTNISRVEDSTKVEAVEMPNVTPIGDETATIPLTTEVTDNDTVSI